MSDQAARGGDDERAAMAPKVGHGSLTRAMRRQHPIAAEHRLFARDVAVDPVSSGSGGRIGSCRQTHQVGGHGSLPSRDAWASSSLGGVRSGQGVKIRRSSSTTHARSDIAVQLPVSSTIDHSKPGVMVVMSCCSPPEWSSRRSPLLRRQGRRRTSGSREALRAVRRGWSSRRRCRRSNHRRRPMRWPDSALRWTGDPP